MTKAAAEKIMGLKIEVIATGMGRTLLGAMDGDSVVATVSVLSERAGFRKLVEDVYAKRRQEAFAKAGWRCEACGEILPLQGDHKIPRSRGRRDLATDIRSLCQSCHGRKHR